MNVGWIVPLIALAVWILSSLIKGAEEPAKAEGKGPPGAPPRPQSEVDKFLEEINRMRRRQAEEQRREVPGVRPQPPQSIPEVVPVEPAAPNFEQQRRPAVVRPSVVQVPVQVPRPRQVKQPRTEAKPPAARPMVVEPPPPPAPPLLPPNRAPAGKLSPAVGQLHALLRSPQSAQVGVLLHEVLGPPRCRRRR